MIEMGLCWKEASDEGRWTFQMDLALPFINHVPLGKLYNFLSFSVSLLVKWR